MPAEESVDINGGTPAYQAPELDFKGAKFSKKADVFAAGIIFLELLSMRSPMGLYECLWPALLEIALPSVLKDVFKLTICQDPNDRILFPELYELLRSQRGQEIGVLKLVPVSGDFNSVMADLASLLASKDDFSSRFLSTPQSYSSPFSR